MSRAGTVRGISVLPLRTRSTGHQLARRPSPSAGRALISANHATGTGSSPLPPAVAGDVMWLRIVPTEDVPPAHHEYVMRHVGRVARKLRLPGPIAVRYFEPVALGEPFDRSNDIPFVASRDGEEPGGFVNPREPGSIALNATFRGEIVAGIIAHEVRHAGQAILAALLNDPEWCERDAHDFASDYLRSARVEG